MDKRNLTDAELLLLGLTAEMPRHGYELEQIIEERGMREWTSIAFSSIYFVLSKLEKRELVKAAKPKGAKAKKLFTLTADGQEMLISQSLHALEVIAPGQSGLMLGMLHWQFLPKLEALKALACRKKKLMAEIARLEGERFRRQPLPDYVDAMFDYAEAQLAAEQVWLNKTYLYFENRIELKGN